MFCFCQRVNSITDAYGVFYKLVYYSIRKCSYALQLGFALLCHDSQ